MKNEKVVVLRPILASSGTPPFWVRACILSGISLFGSNFSIYLEIIKDKKVWYYGQFWPPQGPLLFGSAQRKKTGKRTAGRARPTLIHSGPNSRSPAPDGNYCY